MTDAPSAFPEKETTLMLPGPVGKLEAIVAPGKGQETAIVAVICHPHSLFGGSMQNKVVHTVAKTLRDLGVATVRFNFRSVGGSDGAYDEGVGETDDVLAVLRWVQQ